jgi:hypothetical protein
MPNYFIMSTERKNPFKRDQALNDATGGQLGEEPRPDPYPEKDPRREVARKSQNRPKTWRTSSVIF